MNSGRSVPPGMATAFVRLDVVNETNEFRRARFRFGAGKEKGSPQFLIEDGKISALRMGKGPADGVTG